MSTDFQHHSFQTQQVTGWSSPCTGSSKNSAATAAEELAKPVKHEVETGSCLWTTYQTIGLTLGVLVGNRFEDLYLFVMSHNDLEVS